MDVRYAQFCPLTRAVEILGERWTVLVLRELFLGPKRFSDLKAALPGISPSVLAERLARLEERGIVARAELPPPAASMVYELDEAGLALKPVLVEMTRWGLRFLGARDAGDTFRPEWLLLGLDVFSRRADSPPIAVMLHAGDGDEAVDLLVRGGPGGTTVTRAGAAPAARTTADVDVQAIVRATPIEVLSFCAGFVPLEHARQSPTFHLDGDESVAAAIPSLFDVRPTPVEAAPEPSPSRPRRRVTARPRTAAAGAGRRRGA